MTQAKGQGGITPSANGKNGQSIAQTRDKLREEQNQVQKEQKEDQLLYQQLLDAQLKNSTISIAPNLQKDESVEKLVSNVERELLFHIIKNMKQRKISIAEAHHLAKDFMNILPVKDKEDLLNKLKKLSRRYPEASELYVKYIIPHEEEKREQLLNTMRSHIQNGDIEKAIDVVKGENSNV